MKNTFALNKNKKIKQLISNMNESRRKWTKEDCLNSGLKYNTKKEFRNNDPKFYSAAYRNGWLKAVCKHMEQ